ncbi:Pimeloyl-ACP methyl ester carboxylesterase [Granulicella rosea]|uniref:Pimeloyl-ACP methyl ester carboxylesterase n=2 Tax=Granulicella rosea TaxID=474952 RepID=A0A239LRT4_9BACT|nr:Pimeloyl-ACP methyl ester carboxylesterase [Granulicella rosea]
MNILPVRQSGESSPALVLMHFLGGSAREWDEVRARLDGKYRCVAIDLPGFGDAAEIPGYTVAEMADSVALTLRALGLDRYVLVGHSMSGKVAAVLARRFADGLLHTGELEGLVLVAPSPASPEPIPDDKRATMLDAFSPLEAPGQPKDGDLSRASRYVSKNESRVMPPEVQHRAVEDVLRMGRAAWRAWLESGSREDWSARVGRLSLPALIVAGEKDTSLGAEQQEKLTLPHFADGKLVVVRDCGHLIPMEKPAELAALLEEFMSGLKPKLVPEEYLRFLESDRVSPKTREVALARIPDPVGPSVFTSEEYATLRAVLARVVPQELGEEIDLAARLDKQLAAGKGDGWRYAVLPGDAQAYKIGLQTLDDLSRELHGPPFAALAFAHQEALLASIAEMQPAAPQMARWFEDLRADAAAIYMSHPATLARAGYSGFGVGGAETPHRGFVQIGVGDVEGWEPRALERK